MGATHWFLLAIIWQTLYAQISIASPQIPAASTKYFI
jgi:hypothetical protein